MQKIHTIFYSCNSQKSERFFFINFHAIIFESRTLWI